VGEKRRHFTPEECERLQRNPFVDKKMLEFVRERSQRTPRRAPRAGKQSPDRPPAVSSPQSSSGATPHSQTTAMNEKTIRLITDKIKTLLQK
jgi:hypothetical protein